RIEAAPPVAEGSLEPAPAAEPAPDGALPAKPSADADRPSPPPYASSRGVPVRTDGKNFMYDYNCITELTDALGERDLNFASYLMRQLVNFSGGKLTDTHDMFHTVMALRPQNAGEALQATHMSAVTRQVMEFVLRLQKAETLEEAAFYATWIDKFLR